VELLPAVEALAVAAGTPSTAAASAQAPAALTAFRGQADLKMGVMDDGITAQGHKIMNRKQNPGEHDRARTTKVAVTVVDQDQDQAGRRPVRHAVLT